MADSWFWIIFLATPIFLLSRLAWWSLRCILRARTLGRLMRAAENPFTPGARVALHGPIRVDRPVWWRELGNLLWYKVDRQERRESSDWNYWESVDHESQLARFTLMQDGREVYVLDDPTRMHGGRSRQEEAGRVPGPFRGLLGGVRTRTVVRWFPVPDRLTVCGRIERVDGAWVVVPDGKLGLFVSSEKPRGARLRESMLGLLGLLGVTTGIAVGLWFYGAFVA